MKEAGEEVLASEHQGKGNRRGSKHNFDIRDYISRVYNYHNGQQQPRQPQQQRNNNSNKLTLAHLLNARRRKTRTFIFAKESDS